jgi:AraC-like DNA-binding protein
MFSQNAYEAPEAAIQALEHELGLFVTIVDFEGLFHTHPGKAILSFNRQTHRKIPACRADFCNDKCIEHCRHRMNAKCLRHPKPFISECWKGLKQIVVPLRFEGRHCGMLYAGCWKSDRSPPPNLSKEFQRIYAELEDFPEERADNLMGIMDFFARGLIMSLHEYGALNTPTVPRAARIATFIRRHAAESIQLTDLAQFLELSNSRTSVLVNSLFGSSFTTLLTEERMRRAKALLLSSEYKVKEIAKQTGFNDEYHFNRVFHKYAGLPPGEFRRKYITRN